MQGNKAFRKPEPGVEEKAITSNFDSDFTGFSLLGGIHFNRSNATALLLGPTASRKKMGFSGGNTGSRREGGFFPESVTDWLCYHRQVILFTALSILSGKKDLRHLVRTTWIKEIANKRRKN